ncbi:hypothetical protein B0A70_06470 [Chryseobacterium piscicola]|nr:hypothetical protein B0A70_06470 [Chryseobacterium piscicola]
MTEEFSLGEFAQTDNQPTHQVRIEDVENIKMPQSFLMKELHPSQTQKSLEENPSLEELRKRFEAEHDIDEMIPVAEQNKSENENEKETKKEVENPSEKENIPNQNINEPDENSKTKESDNKKNYWKELLNLSETTVKMVANYEGQKVYHSTI